MALVGSDFYSNDSTKPPVVEYRFMYIIPAAMYVDVVCIMNVSRYIWEILSIFYTEFVTLKSSYLWSFFMSEKMNIHVNFFKSHTIYIEKQVFIYVLSRYILCSINSVTYLVLCKTMSKICKSSQQAILSFLFLKGILFFYYLPYSISMLFDE